MLLHLFSDANYNLLGFNATYTFSLCPGACGGHGRCDSTTSKCHCHQGWGGASCTTPLCTQACSSNGQCDKVSVGNRRNKGEKRLFICHRKTHEVSQLCDLIKQYCYLHFMFCHREENAVCATKASWVTAVNLVSMMTVEPGSGGVLVRETRTHLRGLVLLGSICPPLEPCTCLGVSVAWWEIPLVLLIWKPTNHIPF